MSEGQEVPQASWGKSENLMRRLEGSPRYCPADRESPYGYFDGRKVIGRDVPINKGVYLSSGTGVAIVVDDETFSKELNDVYQEFQENIKPGKGNLLDIASNLVAEKLGHFQTSDMEQEVANLENNIKASRTEKDPMVPLNFFIKKGVGVCKHRALLVGYLLERKAKDGKLMGKVSVDRNVVGDGGHAWVRYTEPPPRNTVSIVDPSLGFVGSLQEAEKKWAYRRPNESKVA